MLVMKVTAIHILDWLFSDLVSQVHLNKSTSGPRLAATVCDYGVIKMETLNGRCLELQKKKQANKVWLIQPKQKDQTSAFNG